VEAGRVAPDLRCDDNADAPAAQFWKARGVARAMPLRPWEDEWIGEFAAADLFLRPALVAIEFHRVHRDVEMTVEDQFAGFGWGAHGVMCGRWLKWTETTTGHGCTRIRSWKVEQRTTNAASLHSWFKLSHCRIEDWLAFEDSFARCYGFFAVLWM
jgi:hypothetical protein